MSVSPLKPLGRSAYGSIPHLPGSRQGDRDVGLHPGQARILTERVRDKRDRILVQEKADGSNVAVAKLDGRIVALTRAGYRAVDSFYPQHWMWDRWVMANVLRFDAVLQEGERLCGEWLAQAHGTLYDLTDREPFVPFDLFTVDHKRLPYADFVTRLGSQFVGVTTLHSGGPLPVVDALALLDTYGLPIREGEMREGVVYRAERQDHRTGLWGVDFLAKYVRMDKVDGRYLPELSGGAPVWLWDEAVNEAA